MRNTIFTILILLSFVTFSCRKEAVNKPADAITVTGQMASHETLKTQFINPSVNWQAGIDQIGFYSDRAYTTAPGVYAANVPYTAQTTSPTSVFTGDATVYWDGTLNVHNFYAYYPYAPGTPSVTAIPISLPSVQAQVGTSTSHIGALDFEVATPLALTPNPGNNPLAAFSYNHAFTILKFDLTCASDNILSSIVLTSEAPAISLSTGSTIDITQTPPAAGAPYNITTAPGGDPLKVTLFTNMSVTSSTASAYMVILPGNASGKTFMIEYNSAAGKTFRVFKAGINFERGKVYTITQAIPTGVGGW